MKHYIIHIMQTLKKQHRDRIPNIYYPKEKKMGKKSMTDHRINLTGVSNARELGGWVIGDHVVRKGLLLRTASLNQAGPEAAARLQEEYHIQTVVDFRMKDEANANPDPVIPGCSNILLPVIETEDLPPVDSELQKFFTNSHKNRLQFFEMLYETGGLGTQLYIEFLLGDRGKQAYRRFFQAVLKLDEERSILWHCTDGKDRTGCAAMLLLYALGASYETVMEDYLLTNSFQSEKLLQVSAELSDESMPQEKQDALHFFLGGASEGYMDRAIKALEKEYGSVTAYLAQELGISKTDRDQLRARFLV